MKKCNIFKVPFFVKRDFPPDFPLESTLISTKCSSSKFSFSRILLRGYLLYPVGVGTQTVGSVFI